MKSIAELFILITLGAFLAFPFAILVREAGGLFNFIGWMMIATGTLGGGIFTFQITREMKSIARRVGVIFVAAMLCLLFFGFIASAVKDIREEQCQQTEGAFSRALSECDGPIGG